MILYGVPLSPFVRKTMFMLYELDLPFDQEMVVPQGDAPAFRETSPLGRIPGFADEEFKMSDSSAICHYLARRDGSPLIDYDDPEVLARIVGYDKYADEDLAPAVFDPLAERVIKPMRLNESPDESKVQATIQNKMPIAFDYLDGRLAESRQRWFAGADFTYADIALGAHMANLPLADIELDADRWPALGRWFEQVRQRVAFIRIIDEARNFCL